VRCLHNFLAAAKSLIDHTRAFVNFHYQKHSFSKLYQGEVERNFASDPLSSFVQDLRNYFLHKGMPSISMVIKVGEQSYSSIFLNTANLKKWDKWNAKSLLYLELQPDEFRLLDPVVEYKSKLTIFNEWFEKELHNIHAEEIIEFNILQERYRSLMNRR
jgi:hypothetical protein